MPCSEIKEGKNGTWLNMTDAQGVIVVRRIFFIYYVIVLRLGIHGKC